MGSVGNSSSGVTSKDVIALRNTDDMKTVTNWYRSHGFDISGVSDTASKELLIGSSRGISKLLSELPQSVRDEWLDKLPISLSYNIKNNNAYASASIVEVLDGAGGTINLNQKYYGQGNDIRAQSDYRGDVIQKFHPANTTADAILSHEFGHLLEAYMCKKLTTYVTTWGGVDRTVNTGHWAWNSDQFSKQIVEDAFDTVRGRLRTDKGNQIKSAKSAMKTISEYAGYSKRKGYHECIAEAISDYATNGNNAHPLSVAIWKNIKSLLK